MCSRRAFLIGLFLVAQMGIVPKPEARVSTSTKKKFLKQGWVLQEGDV